MKKLILLSASLIIMFSASYSQEYKIEKIDLASYKNQLRFSPFNFAFSELQMNYERYLAPDFSLKLDGAYIYKDSSDKITEGLRTELSAKYHIINNIEKKAIFRMYFSPYITRSAISINYPDSVYVTEPVPAYRKNFNIKSIGGGMLIGFNFTFAKRLNIDFFLGGGIKKSDDDNAPEIYSKHIFKPAYSGVYPKFGFDIGFAF